LAFLGEISREKWVLRGEIWPARGGWGEIIAKKRFVAVLSGDYGVVFA